MIRDLEGRSLTMADIHFAILDLPIGEIKVLCNARGFYKIKEMFSGWLELPECGGGDWVISTGVCPLTMKKMTIIYAPNAEGIKFVDGDGKVIIEISNYDACFER